MVFLGKILKHFLGIHHIVCEINAIFGFRKSVGKCIAFTDDFLCVTPFPLFQIVALGVSNAPANEMLRVVVLSLGGLADNKFLYVKKLTTHLPQNVNPMKIKTLSDKKNKGCRNITMFFL